MLFTIPQLIVISLIAWVLIIIIHAVSKADKHAKSEMVKDGNSLFISAISYIIATFVCMCFSNSILHWIICVGMFVFAFIPIITTLLLFIQPNVPLSQKITALISEGLPVFFAINVLLSFCL